MFQIIFYTTEQGRSEVSDFLDDIYNNPQDKNKQIIKNRYEVCKKRLQQNGLRNSMPHVEFLQDGIWQLRPVPYRIPFYANKKGEIILLSVFPKTTGATPKHELERAKARRKDWENRNR